MANIRPYEAPAGLDLRPSETGIETVAGNARRLGAYGNQIADTFNQEGQEVKGAVADSLQVGLDYMDHREISAGAANFAQFMAQKNAEWEDTAKNADPNDPSVKQKFLEENLEPAMQQFQQGFNTEKSQAWAEHAVDQYRNHMFEKTSATMATLAGEAVKVNVAKTINGLSSAVAIDPSTHSIDNAFQTLDHSVGAMVDSSPTIGVEQGAAIKGEVAQHAKEQIVKSAVSSMITKNPNIDLDAIQKKYGDYIKGDEMKQFQKAAQTQAKVDFLQNRAIERERDYQATKAAGADFSKTLSDNVTFDPDGKVSVKPEFYKGVMDTVKKYPGAADDTARALIQFGEHQQAVKRETIVTDPAAQSDLLARMSDPKNPTTETQILMEANKSKLDAHATSNLLALRKALDESPIKTPEFQAIFGAAKSTMEQAYDGHERFANFAYQFLPAYQAAVRNGTLKPDDLDVTKEDSLISRAMKSAKKPTPDEVMMYHITRNTGVDPSNIWTFNGGSSAKPGPTVAPPTKVSTPADATKLKPGTRYETPDGKVYVR